MIKNRPLLAVLGIVVLGFLFSTPARAEPDLILMNGKVYTYKWADPQSDGTPASGAPISGNIWEPDAQAIAIQGGRILAVGTNDEIMAHRTEQTRVIDLKGATVIPGLVDSHAHIDGIGANLEKVDVSNAANEAEAVQLVAAHAKNVPKGEWIVARGWDEGAWAGHYPDMKLLTEKVPDHPVVMGSLHGFVAWCNRLALERADITGATATPVGGEIVKDADGRPNGLFMNNAVNMLFNAVSAPTLKQIKRRVLAGIEEMARSGYTAVHIPGVGTELMAALETLDGADALKIRIYAMISAKDEKLMRTWLAKGPEQSNDGMLIRRSVKAYYDGALGSRGARLLEDYTDRPGHRGVSGEAYGFDEELVAEMMLAGFQVGTHAIGDAGNRETLDFFEKVQNRDPETKNGRHRIEHAQVIHPDDFSRFADMKIIASMEPPHAVEDKTWAEERLGPERIRGAYAWRTLRKAGVRLTFNSDLTGSDHDIFYGLHAAFTRRSKDLQPPNGWYFSEAMTMEEAIRGYTVWSAYAAFLENVTGGLEAGKWADITAISLDPHNLTSDTAASLFEGSILLTVVNGKVVYENPNRSEITNK